MAKKREEAEIKPEVKTEPKTDEEVEIMREGTLTAKVVQISKTEDPKRVKVTLSTKFYSILLKDESETITDSFSIDSINLLQMLAESGEQYGGLFNAVCMRQRPNATILALLYNGGEFTIKREYKKATDIRENGKEQYGHNLYKSYVLAAKATANQTQIQFALQLMQSNPIEKDVILTMPNSLTI